MSAESSSSSSDQTLVKGVPTHGGRYLQYNVYGNLFEVSRKYVPPIRPVGRGAYGIVCAAVNSETREEVAIKKIGNAFDNRIDAKRTLREIKLLRHMDHENVVALKDIIRPPMKENFNDLIGSPDESSLGFLRSDNARRYVRMLPQFPKQNFSARFPNVSPGAVDLLEKMLVFDPNRRITVDEALCHPYLAPLHDINEEPVCPRPFSFDFEHPSFTEENIKELIYRETVNFNPDPTH
ncbi:hypothetical protein EZV62_009922 [Acer yangbiense]|uniref:mitogen-activated protein kinase n=1 Tax=Acer yangbiense TaxID=1000413 RepID=A0A5C7I1U3_9ROSI|nr:hypothetical protein EZV62_009922 [Acer yangbiense]